MPLRKLGGNSGGNPPLGFVTLWRSLTLTMGDSTTFGLRRSSHCPVGKSKEVSRGPSSLQSDAEPAHSFYLCRGVTRRRISCGVTGPPKPTGTSVKSGTRV